LSGGQKENKVPKRKFEIRGEKTRKVAGRKSSCKKNLKSGLRKGKQKKSAWDGTWIENIILSMHHPSTLVHE
jgi:hypothetical protein